MKRSRYTAEQVTFALRQAESGTPVPEVCRKMGISEQTLRYAQGQALLSVEEAILRPGCSGGTAAEDTGGGEPQAPPAGSGPEPG